MQNLKTRFRNQKKSPRYTCKANEYIKTFLKRCCFSGKAEANLLELDSGSIKWSGNDTLILKMRRR